jgi:hypothetical protein
MRRETWGALLGLLAVAGLSLALAACDEDTRGDSSDGDADGDSDGDSDSDSDADECADYRTVYPEGPYGTAVESVMADIPGLVDGNNDPHDLTEIFLDTSVVALAIANAFDT